MRAAVPGIVDLRTRDVGLTELMDDPGCDLGRLRRTYAHFRTVNALLSGWQRVYRRQIRPLLSVDRTSTWLDLGSGGGDLARAAVRWAARDGLRLEVTGIDPDERAYAYASALAPVPGVTFRRASSSELVAEGASFDVVTSNHVLHHLSADELPGVLEDSRRLARRLVVHSDLARSRAAHAAWWLVSWPFGRRSFLHTDGLLSIRRSYRATELAGRVSSPWSVRTQFPARLLLSCEVGAAS